MCTQVCSLVCTQRGLENSQMSFFSHTHYTKLSSMLLQSKKESTSRGWTNCWKSESWRPSGQTPANLRRAARQATSTASLLFLSDGDLQSSMRRGMPVGDTGRASSPGWGPVGPDPEVLGLPCTPNLPEKGAEPTSGSLWWKLSTPSVVSRAWLGSGQAEASKPNPQMWVNIWIFTRQNS